MKILKIIIIRSYHSYQLYLRQKKDKVTDKADSKIYRLKKSEKILKNRNKKQMTYLKKS